MKKFYVNCNSPQRKFVWPGKMMKIFVLALVAACLSFSGRVMAQSQRVTLDLKSCSIIEFFRQGHGAVAAGYAGFEILFHYRVFPAGSWRSRSGLRWI